MRTLKIITAFMFVTMATAGQDISPSDVPTAVRDAFVKEYANATHVEWEKNMDNYEVEFDLNRKEMEVLYNPSGEVVRKKQDINETELPRAIREAIATNYPGYKVDDVDTLWENEATTFIVELEKGREEKQITFDSNAKVIHEKMD